ncbi:sensor histidine kinase [Actinomadura scrupuli]|uniref:sensor histidine kinase n=1 Tax=Actinomadura scrupuli TaxID=559629 RepID=UPI003D99D5FC
MDRSLRMHRASLHAVGSAVVCAGFSVMVVIGAHGRDVADNTRAAVKAGEQVVPLVKQDRLPRVLPGDEAAAVQVLDAGRRVVAATARSAGRPPMASFRPDGDELITHRDLCPPTGLEGCMTVAALRFYQPEGNWMVYSARPVVPIYGNWALIGVLGGLSALVAGVAGVGTYKLVGRTLAPMEAIQAELAEITATAFHRRVPVPATPEEVRLLAEAVNTTLDRLESAHEKLRNYTSDVSHDLRGPITAIRAQLEEALMSPEDTEWPRTAGSMMAGVERLQALVSDLLVVAQLDAGVPLAREVTDLSALVATELDQRPRNKKISRDLAKGVFTRCDRMRICRVVANLMDNAERHADSQISVVVRHAGAMALLEVIDDGAGIPADQHETVFQRFTRLDDSRELDPCGTGLGLAIGSQIAEAHHGTLTIQDSPRGAHFVLRLPATRSDRESVTR